MSNPQDPQNQPYQPAPNGYPPPGYFPPQPGYPSQGQGGYNRPQPSYPDQPPFNPPPSYGYVPPAGYSNQPPPYYGYPPQPGGYPSPYGFVPPPGYAVPFDYAGANTNPLMLAKATFWQRVGASLIDGILFFIISFILGLILALAFFTTTRNSAIAVSSNSLVLNLITILPTAIYQIWLVSLGQTLGDKTVKIRIVDSEGNPPGFTRSCIRYSIPFVFGIGISLLTSFTYSRTGSPITSSNGRDFINLGSLANLVLLVGYLWMLWDPQKQTLFDKLAGTYVLKTL